MKYIIFFLFCFSNVKQIKAQTDSSTSAKPVKQAEKIQPDIGKYMSSDYSTTHTRAIIGLKDHSLLYVDHITTYLDEVMVDYTEKKYQ